MTDYSIYPEAIDGYAQMPLAVDKKTPVNAESVNRLRSGIINIEKAIGVSPDFSKSFGKFNDLADRVNYVEEHSASLEKTVTETVANLENNIYEEIYSALETIDVEALINDLTIDELYLRSGEILLPSDAFSVISEGVDLRATGLIASTMPGIDAFPKTVVLRESEQAPLSGGTGFLSSFASFGGELEESDLAIIKTGSGAFNQLNIIGGLGWFNDPTKNPSNLVISTQSGANPTAPSADISIQAANSVHNTVYGGSVSLYGGQSPNTSSASMIITGGGEVESGNIDITAGAMDAMYGNSCSIFMEGHRDIGGGMLSMSSGGTEVGSGLPAGNVRLAAGSGDAGGSLTLTSGTSYASTPSEVRLVAPENSAGDLGSVIIQGILNGAASFALPIRSFSGSAEGTSCLLGEYDYTVTVNANIPNVQAILPAPATCVGRIYKIKKMDNLHNMNIVVWGGALIDGAASVLLASQYQVVTVQSTGSDWIRLS